MQAARFSAPFLHPRPPPPSEGAAFELPASDTLEGIADAAAAVLRAIADGKITAADGRQLVDILDFRRMSLKRVETERHIAEVQANYSRQRQGNVMT